MSVNAINTAEPVNAGQKKSNNVNVGLIAGTTAGLGLAGAGGGLLWGGTKLTPEQILALSNDTFEARTKDLEGENKTAADRVKTEIDKLNGDDYQVSAETKTKFEEAVDKFDLDANAPEQTAFDDAKTKYEKKLLEKINEGKPETEQFKELNAEGLTDEMKKTAKDALKDTPEAQEFNTAKENLRKAKETAYRAKAETNETIKQVVNAYDNAVKEAAEAKTKKIGELVNQDEIKTALGKIKKFFREGQSKAAWLYGGIAAAAGLIIGMVISSNNKKNA